MRDVAVLNGGDRHDDENIGGAELVVDHRPITEGCPEAQVALDERRQGGERLAHVDRRLVEKIHAHIAAAWARAVQLASAAA